MSVRKDGAMWFVLSCFFDDDYLQNNKKSLFWQSQTQKTLLEGWGKKNIACLVVHSAAALFYAMYKSSHPKMLTGVATDSGWA